jgi:two-component system LytT family response regulator
MINCIALDDEPMALEVIKSHAGQLPYVNLTHSFTQISVAQKHLLKYPVDLIFLDINMPDMNGVDFYKNIAQDLMVIFTTAHSEFAVDGFNVNAVDYLLKPIEFERFKTACDKAENYLEYLKYGDAEKQNSIYVRSEYSLVKILFSEILYLETMDDYIKIHRKQNETVLTLSSMKKMMDKLPLDMFVRVHRSFAVAIDCIESISSKNILINDSAIPIGRSYEKDLLNKIQK